MLALLLVLHMGVVKAPVGNPLSERVTDVRSLPDVTGAVLGDGADTGFDLRFHFHERSSLD